MGITDRRAGLFFAFFLFALVVVVIRVGWIQAVQGDELRDSAKGQQLNTVPLPALRGTIYDRNGKELAISENTYTVEAYPVYIEKSRKAARDVGRILGLPVRELEETFATDETYVPLAKNVDVSKAERLRDLGLGGIGLLATTRRVYPQGPLAAPVIGIVGGENYDGQSGIEAYADTTLKGADGELEVLTDNRGQPMERRTIVETVAGSDLRLSLDAGLQTHVEGVLSSIASTYKAKGVSIVAMDPQTSEVLAMASYPGFDPAKLDKARAEDMRDHSVGINYEPGSTFKAITVAGALEDGLVNPGTTFHLPSEIQVADRVIGEAHARPPITASVSEIVAQSSNVGAILVGQQLGGKRFDQWVKKFGFGEATGISYPGEEIGIVPGYEDYSGASMGNLPIGQGISVTPMQMVAAYAAIANGGVLRPPRLVIERDGVPVPEEKGERIISKQTAAQLRTMLEGVLGAGGTASEVSVPGYTLAGKTGTAEKAENGVYVEEYVASFIGFAPADNPRLLVAVVVDEPEGENAGGVVAAPAFGQIASFALPYLGIPASDPAN